MKPAHALPTLIALVATACASPPGPGDPGYRYNVSGAYAGRLMIADRPFEARLRLRTGRGGSVEGSLRVVSPVEIDGSVRGTLIDDLLRITVTYTGSGGCDGRVEGILDVDPGGAAIEGPITISDCGDPVGARLSFRRSQNSRRPGTER